MRGIDPNASVEELQVRFQGGEKDPEILRQMLDRLSGRQGQRASDLRGKVITRLSQLHEPIPEPPAHTDRAAHPSIRPPGTPGLPAPIAPRARKRTELEIKPDATQAQKYIAALRALIAELKASSKRRYRSLSNGKQVPGTGQTVLYSFEIENSSDLIDDSSVQLEAHGERHDAVIASAQPEAVLISIGTDLGPELPRARLLLDDTALLTQLCERIENIGKNFLLNETLANAIVDQAPHLAPIPALGDSASTARLDSSQMRARESVRTQALTYIWGPPGCGKTFTLAEIVRMAFVAGQRILICSNTNKAVDQVLYGVCKQLQVDHAAALDAGQVIRLGNIVDDQRTHELADALDARIQQGARARCVTRPPHSNLPNTNIGKDALNKLETLGCVVDCRTRIHQKVVIIDGHIVWHGSLNPMSYSQYSDELMTRTLGRGFAQIAAALLAKKRVPLEKVLDVITDRENPHCGQCGKAVRTFLDRRGTAESFVCENFCGWSERLV